MANWFGVAFLAIGAWLLYAGLAQRREVIAARAQAEARGEDPDGAPLNPSLAMMGDIVPPIIHFALAIVGLKVTAMYFMLDLGRMLSLVDLGGFLFLLAGYGTWIKLTTKYRRLVRTAPVEKPEDEALPAAARRTGAPASASDRHAAAPIRL